jgi:hypothetical protein
LTKDGLASGDAPPPPGVVCQIAAWWQNNIAHAADPTRGGALNPGFAGRLYLFGPYIDHPMPGDGSLLIEMFDETQGAPVKKEQWEIDAQTLHRLLRRDMIGWGYTLFLPSAEVKPEMTKLRLRSCYRPAKGSPMYCENMVTLDAGNGVIRGEAQRLPLPSPVLPPGPSPGPAAQPAPLPPPGPAR